MELENQIAKQELIRKQMQEKIEFQEKQLQKKENLEYIFKLEEENETLRKKQKVLSDQNFELGWKLKEIEQKFPRRRSNFPLHLNVQLNQLSLNSGPKKQVSKDMDSELKQKFKQLEEFQKQKEHDGTKGEPEPTSNSDLNKPNEKGGIEDLQRYFVTSLQDLENKIKEKDE